MKKRAMCWLLTLVMLLSLAPVGALAASGDEVAKDETYSYTAKSTDASGAKRQGSASYSYDSGLIFKDYYGGTITATITPRYNITSLVVSGGTIQDVTAALNTSAAVSPITTARSKPADDGYGSTSDDRYTAAVDSAKDKAKTAAGNALRTAVATVKAALGNDTPASENAVRAKLAGNTDPDVQAVMNAIIAALNAAPAVTINPTHTVIWSVNGADVETDETEEGKQPEYNGSEPFKPGEMGVTYTFAGWSADPNAESGVDASALPAVTGDVTYYAIFIASGDAQPVAGGSKTEDGVTVSKYAETADDGSFTITMNAYAQGASHTSTDAIPTDYVLVLDLSRWYVDKGFMEWKQFENPIGNYNFRAEWFNTTSPEYMPLFVHEEETNSYILVQIISAKDYRSDSEAMAAFCSPDWQNVRSHTGSDTCYALAYKSKIDNKFHLVKSPTNGAYWGKNTESGIGGTGAWYLAYADTVLYEVNNTAAAVGNMTRLKAMKDSILSFLEQLKDNDQATVQIIGFADTYKVISTKRNVKQWYDDLVKTVQNLDLSSNSQQSVPSTGLGYVNSNIWKTNKGENDPARVVLLYEAHLPMLKDDMYKNVTAANNAISAAKTIKARGAEIFAIGLYASGYERYPLQNMAKSSLTSTDTLFSSYTLDDYLQTVSSNYPEASALNLRKTKTTDNHTLYAKDNLELDDAFKTVVNSTQTALTELDENAVIRDYITGNFDLSGAEATAKVVSMVDGAWDEENGEPFTGTVTLDKQARTVTATGFSYKDNYYLDENTGKKLVVTVTGLVPVTSGVLPTNTAESGLFADQDAETAQITFPVPSVKVGAKTYVADFNAKFTVATEVAKAPAVIGTLSNGSFGLDGASAWYQLDSGKIVQNRTADAALDLTTVSTADAAMIGGVHSGDTEKSWQKVNVVPATNIYYSDTIADATVTAADDEAGYTPGLTASTDAASGKYAFTFTGSRFDVYFTTGTDTGVIGAILYQDGQIVEDADGNKFVRLVNGKTGAEDGSSGAYANTPAMRVEPPTPGTYTVVITANSAAKLSIDGVRVYNEQANTVEGDVQYLNLRDVLVGANTDLTVTTGDSAMFFTDKGDMDLATDDNPYEADTEEYRKFVPADYENVGPKNEIYLAKGQGVGFVVSADVESVAVGMRTPEGGTVTLSADGTLTNDAGAVALTDLDMYYPVAITEVDGSRIVFIRNDSDTMVSVTNVKLTGASVGGSLSVTEDLLQYLESFLQPILPDTPIIPETPDDGAKAVWASDAGVLKTLMVRLMQVLFGLFDGLAKW